MRDTWIPTLVAILCLPLLFACGEESPEGGAQAPRGTVQSPSDGDKDREASASSEPAERNEPTPFANRAEEAERKRALLISINRYDLPGIKDLRGPANDLAVFKDLLQERFLFPEEHIHVLQDQQATIGAVLNTIDAQFCTAPRGSELVIYYAGHGSRVYDKERLEASNWDSSLVLYDSRRKGRKGSHDLTDDVMRGILDQLCNKLGHRVTLITDSCHSGSLTRGDLVARSIATSEEVYGQPDPKLWGQVPAWVRVVSDRERVDFAGHFVHLAACGSEQRAMEGELQGVGEYHGFFTWALCSVLREAQPGDRYRDLALRSEYRTRLLFAANKRSGYPQNPQFDGDPDREIFSRAFSAQPFRHLARVVDGQLTIQGGSFHGFEVGAHVAVRVVKGDVIGEAELSSVQLMQSRATWTPAPPTEIPELPLEVEWLRAAESSDILVHCADPALVAEINAIDGLRARGPRIDGRGGEAFALDLRRWEGGLTISSLEGQPLLELPSEEEERARALRKFEARERLWRGLWEMAGRAPMSVGLAKQDLPLLSLIQIRPEDARVRQMLENQGRDPDAFGALGWDAEGALPGEIALPPRRDPEGRFMFFFRLRVERKDIEGGTLFPVVLALSERRHLHVVLPDTGEKSAPAIGSEDGAYFIDRDLFFSHQHFDDWRLTRPERWRYLLLISNKPMSVELFRKVGRESTAQRGGETGLDYRLMAQLGLPTETTRSRRVEKLWGLTAIEVGIQARPTQK
jgi:hypothetical protein